METQGQQIKTILYISLPLCEMGTVGSLPHSPIFSTSSAFLPWIVPSHCVPKSFQAPVPTPNVLDNPSGAPILNPLVVLTKTTPAISFVERFFGSPPPPRSVFLVFSPGFSAFSVVF